VKAFKTYHTLPNLEDNKELEDEDDNELELIDLTEILEGEDNLEETQGTTIHFIICSINLCHTSHPMHLIATIDIDAYFIDENQINKNNPSIQSFKKLYREVMTNLSKLWSRQNQSTIVAEHIHNTLGVYLKVPNKTRWNSTFI
jgi:hypothetical protein